MNKNRIIPAVNFKPTPNDVITFDSNILIKLFYPALCGTSIAPYDLIYAAVLSAGSRLLITSIQVSEFINRCIRFQFELYKKSQNGGQNIEFKRDYRNTDDYHNCMKAILDIVKTDIFLNFAVMDDSFSKMDPEMLFQYGFSYDFNDSVLIEFAQLKNAILVTDDRDFGNYISNVQIVTANKTLLMFS